MASGDKGLEEIPDGESQVFIDPFCWQSPVNCADSPQSVVFSPLTANFAAAQIESNYDEITDSFDAMNLKSELLRGMSFALKKLSKIGN